MLCTVQTEARRFAFLRLYLYASNIAAVNSWHALSATAWKEGCGTGEIMDKT